MSYAQTLFSFTDTNTIYFGKARQKAKYIAWEHLKRPGVTEWYRHDNIDHPYYIRSFLIQIVITHVLHFTHENLLPVNSKSTLPTLLFGKFYLTNPISRILCQKMNCDISTLNVIK